MNLCRKCQFQPWNTTFYCGLLLDSTWTSICRILVSKWVKFAFLSLSRMCRDFALFWTFILKNRHYFSNFRHYCCNFGRHYLSNFQITGLHMISFVFIQLWVTQLSIVLVTSDSSRRACRLSFVDFVDWAGIPGLKLQSFGKVQTSPNTTSSVNILTNL